MLRAAKRNGAFPFVTPTLPLLPIVRSPRAFLRDAGSSGVVETERRTAPGLIRVFALSKSGHIQNSNSGQRGHSFCGLGVGAFSDIWKFP